MEKTLPRGLCIRRKDKNRKQSRNNYIRIRIPRVLIYSQNRTNSRVRHYQQARTPPPPTATPYRHLFADNLTTLVLTHSQTRFQLPSLRCNRQISRPLISPSLSREISPSRLGHCVGRVGRRTSFQLLASGPIAGQKSSTRTRLFEVLSRLGLTALVAI
jgi:hypothetical protein